MPQSGADVPDDMDARLVVLSIDHPYSKDPTNKAQAAATAILESRGAAPRLFRNTLTFLAVDQTRLQDLDEAVRRYLAWESITLEKEALNLDPQQLKQAETQVKSARMALLSPGSPKPTSGSWFRRKGARNLPSNGMHIVSPARTHLPSAPANDFATRSFSCRHWPEPACGWSSTGFRFGAAMMSRSSNSRKISRDICIYLG